MSDPRALRLFLLAQSFSGRAGREPITVCDGAPCCLDFHCAKPAMPPSGLAQWSVKRRSAS